MKQINNSTMNISHLKRASVVCLFWCIAQVGSTTEEYEAGIDYKVLELKEDAEGTETLSEESEKISVIEYFSYGCIACKKLEPHISEWLVNKEDDVEFNREAVVFQKDWVPLAKAYYVAIELDVLDSVHIPMFEAIHDEKRKLEDPSNIEQLFKEKAEVDPKVFRATYNDSESIVDHILEVHETIQAMVIKNTPTVVVDGRFLVNTRTAQSRKRIFPIVDFLIKKVRTERQNISVIEAPNA
ncbi:MAG: thiol:disulfide interchange protein DsbA/DsbL [Gammaproteobacteria bacterium]|nr:thiol:disulfide interchange protein DsbA/DsbL [Gammaproteobacteria bacterium]